MIAVKRVAAMAKSGAIYYKPQDPNGLAMGEDFHKMIVEQRVAMWPREMLFAGPSNEEPKFPIGAAPIPSSPLPFFGTDGTKNSALLAPAWSCYRDHRAGQPTYQLGLRVPWPSAAPDVLYSPKGVGYSHLMRAERFLHAWLETSGYDYDLVTDLDLHADPGLLHHLPGRLHGLFHRLPPSRRGFADIAFASIKDGDPAIRHIRAIGLSCRPRASPAASSMRSRA